MYWRFKLSNFKNLPRNIKTKSTYWKFIYSIKLDLLSFKLPNLKLEKPSIFQLSLSKIKLRRTSTSKNSLANLNSSTRLSPKFKKFKLDLHRHSLPIFLSLPLSLSLSLSGGLNSYETAIKRSRNPSGNQTLAVRSHLGSLIDYQTLESGTMDRGAVDVHRWLIFIGERKRPAVLSAGIRSKRGGGGESEPESSTKGAFLRRYSFMAANYRNWPGRYNDDV